jgi:aromatic-amino-acid transaminase
MQHLIPSRQTRPSGDAIFTLNAEANQRRSAGESIVNATLGTLMRDDGALALLETASKTVHGISKEDWAAYAPIAGTPDFLKAVIHDTLHSVPMLKAAAVAAATPGGTGALRHAIMNYLEPGQALLTTSFFWGPYQTLVDEHERRLETFSMFSVSGGLDVTALEAKVADQLRTQKRVLLFLNDPCQNPTGYSMSPGEWQAVVEALLRQSQRGPITLLVDMAYWLYGSAPDPRGFLQHLVPLLGRVGLLFAWSASKSFTHYGLRVGALISCVADEHDRAATDAALAYACRGTWSNCTRGGLMAVTKLLTDPALAAACTGEREVLKQSLAARVAAFNEVAKAKSLLYPRYEGGFFVTVFCDDAVGLAKRMKQRGVFVVPQAGAVRVALCSVAVKDVSRVVEALSSA